MANKVTVHTKKVRFPVAKDLYGLFYEDINRAGDGGIYPEMIRNRSFEDSLVPEGCVTDEQQLVYINRGGWPGCFNHGEGMDEWAAKVPYTSIPGWYAENAEMELCAEDTLNPNRKRSLMVDFAQEGRVWNIGYAGVPLVPDRGYRLVVFLKAETAFTLTASLESEAGDLFGCTSTLVKAQNDWQKIELSLTATGEDYGGRIVLSTDRAVRVLFGYTSLLPTETFKNHGLRTDLVEALMATHPKFLRFPGGCIVEGVSFEAAMKFSNTIGPAWERPTLPLMWHYRTTNGFGYHEFLQLCEDTGMEPLYVCNCGMSCQARVTELFPEEKVDKFLEEALGALEYALGDVTTKYGAMRAAAGHPEPFKMTYFEIGNENFGPAYNERYLKFYNALKAAYPDVIYISNCHTEQDGLPTEYADEHYYDTPEFFLENDNRFDDYDRNGPKIFLGEYAVNGGNTIASMECAMAEAVFLAGVERNQDIVKLTAFAPLLQNSDYTDWMPNLVVFDNHRVYGIPSYHAISLMAGNRGERVLETETDVDMAPPAYKGVPGIMSSKPGLQFKNARVNGKSVDIGRAVYGGYEQKDDVTTLVQADNPHPFIGKNPVWNETFDEFINDHLGIRDDVKLMWVTFADEDREKFTFEAEVKFDRDNEVTFSIWNYHPDTDVGCNEPKDVKWNLRNVRRQVWSIADGKGSTDLPSPNAERKTIPLDIDYGVFNRYRIEADRFGYRCYINDNLVQQKTFQLHNTVYAVATDDEREVILKLIHVGAEEKDVEIVLDCDVEPEVAIQTLSAPLDAVNSFDKPCNVAPVSSVLPIGAQTFTYRIAAHSVNVLRLQKR